MDVAEARPLPGGPLALDLLNTTWRHDGAPVDWLDLDDAVHQFARSWDVEVLEGEVEATRDALVEARELIRRLLASGHDADDLADLNVALSAARIVAIEVDGGLELAITSDDSGQVLAVRALADVVELLDRQAERIRSCEHPECVLWFLDTSKAGRRRWCSMERCGNRIKAKRHYARATGEPHEQVI